MTDSSPIRKAVIPAAGFGTRFLPVTRTVPKVMLPVVDTPALHYVIEEAVESGIEQVAVIVSPEHESVGAYFRSTPKLERALEARNDDSLLERMRRIARMADVTTVVQHEQRGLGHAVAWPESSWATSRSRSCFPTTCSGARPRRLRDSSTCTRRTVEAWSLSKKSRTTLCR